MPRVIAAGLILLCLGGLAGQARQEAAATQHGESKRERQCRFQWMEEGTWTPREEARTVACVLARWPVSGGIQFFRTVIQCESGWNRLAYNPSGPYVGLAQHHLGSWPGRVAYYLPDWWHVGHFGSWRNSRSQITVTVLMVRAQGWTPWTCAN